MVYDEKKTNAHRNNHIVYPIALLTTGHQHIANDNIIGPTQIAIGILRLPNLVLKLSVIEANGISINPSKARADIHNIENNNGITKQVPLIV
ncbi:MAG: hypothetical protein MJ219_02305 [Mycoplasmoidaceae bacterium]|nr:hypothetical protein [Mycoplasmoidaceae bacterium]